MKRFSARLRRLALAIAGIIAVAAPVLAEEATPQAFLTTLYHRYEGRHTRGIDYADKRTLLRYFEPSLVGLITADQAAAKKDDEVPALDGDPFVDAQEWEITHLAIAAEMNGPDKATGTVSFRNFNEPKRLTVQLVRLKAGWRIADIVWPDGSLRGLYTDNH
jgi:Protein of unknown function (DUF3828)